ncbi:hypothetical protein [Streptomyces canus]|uniref:hypothetical protein n=1 Tax=Streptomyces canus TaxID=58343 RepID=UPI00386AD498
MPTGKVRYDNLRSAVSRVLGFCDRRESDRWVAFRSSAGLDAFYCLPGIEGAHEKGGVKGEVGGFRRNHLVPVPEVDSLADIKVTVDRWAEEDDGRRIGAPPRTVGEYFAAEQPLLRPLPEDVFKTGRLFSPRVDRHVQITVRQTIVDRLTFGSNIIETGSDSYRLAQTHAQQDTAS